MSGRDEAAWEIARRVCTPAEIKALELHEQVGYRRIAVILGISFDAARDRVRRAEAKVMREMNGRGGP